MHNPQDLNATRNLINPVKDTVVTNSKPEIRVADTPQPFDPALALFRGVVLQMFFHSVSNLGGVVFAECIHVGNCASLQHDRVDTHSKIMP